MIEMKRSLSCAELICKANRIGNEICVQVSGGDTPHIGCVVLAIPRTSLTGSGEKSATSSVLNVTGHKDEEICRYIAEEIAKKRNVITVCAGGFHIDGIKKEQIQEVLDSTRNMTKELIERLEQEGM
ncbi:MAG: hypothetical protein ACI4LN_04310 [Anaerovoracaceae bacterium]